jgi:IS30 family transposase
MAISSGPNRTADVVTEVIIHMLNSFQDKVHTLTVNNGKGFALHQQIAIELDASTISPFPIVRGNED